MVIVLRTNVWTRSSVKYRLFSTRNGLLWVSSGDAGLTALSVNASMPQRIGSEPRESFVFAFEVTNPSVDTFPGAVRIYSSVILT